MSPEPPRRDPVLLGNLLGTKRELAPCSSAPRSVSIPPCALTIPPPTSGAGAASGRIQEPFDQKMWKARGDLGVRGERATEIGPGAGPSSPTGTPGGINRIEVCMRLNHSKKVPSAFLFRKRIVTSTGQVYFFTVS